MVSFSLVAFCILCAFIIFERLLWMKYEPNDSPTDTQVETVETDDRLKVLYIVNSVEGKNGEDPVTDTIIPVLSVGVKSMLSFGYSVDVYIVSSYEMSQERRHLIRESLPQSVALDVWDDAAPIGYDTKAQPMDDRVTTFPEAVFRQHRFIIRDKLFQYDMFVAFQDDMLIKGEHIENYMEMSDQIYQLQQQAKRHPNNITTTTTTDKKEIAREFHGPMTEKQLARFIPGFFRVEYVEKKDYTNRDREGKLPIDLFLDNGATMLVDASACCYRNDTSLLDAVIHASASKMIESEKMVIVQTQVRALGLRKMPPGTSLDWVVLIPGSTSGNMPADRMIGDYWTGRDGHFDGEKRAGRMAVYSLQDGWMATRRQIVEWEVNTCPHQVLPPFQHRYAGMVFGSRFWTGPESIFGVKGCQLQRIVNLEPSKFSRQLIHHTKDNLQTYLKAKYGDQAAASLMANPNTFLGQLNSVRKNAMKEIAKTG